MRFVMLQLIVTIRCVMWTTSVCSAYVLLYLRFSVVKICSKVKYLNCEGYSSFRCVQ